jgi:hypothetical protein
MFAPFPLKEDGWFVVAARLANGTQVDLLRDGTALNWDKPFPVTSIYRDAQWQKYLMNLWAVSNAPHRGHYAAYLTNQWNRTHDENHQIASLQLFYMREDTLPNYYVSKVQKVLLWERNFK